MPKKIKPEIQKYLVTVKMHPLFNKSMMHTALIGMLVNVVSVETVGFLPPKRRRRK